MFTHDCTSCGRHELIFPDQITGLDTLTDHYVVHFTCWCDAPRRTSSRAWSPPPEQAPARRTGSDWVCARPPRYASAVALGRRAALAQSVERVTRND